MQKSIPIISLFSGGGLLDLGFLNQGFQIESAIEINPNYAYAYNFALEKHFCKTNNYFIRNNIVHHKPVAYTIDASDKNVQIDLGKKYKKISGLIGGPPCQDYSIGGKNMGVTGERGRLLLTYLSLLDRIRPDFLFFENVDGLYRNNVHKEAFRQLLSMIDNLGYAYWYDILNPLNFGFPQDRPRIVVVGFKKKIIHRLAKRGFCIEQNDEYEEARQLVFRWPRKLFDSPKLAPWPRRWPFGKVQNCPLIDIPEEYSSLQVINAFKDLTNETPNQSEWFNAKSAKFWLVDEGDTSRKSFKRLHRYRYSPTVAYGNNEVHLHPTEARRLSVREALRLQTVPDTYILPSDLPLTHKYKIIGNGVPSSYAELLAKEIRRTMCNYYDSRQEEN